METRDGQSTTCNPKVMSRCLSVPDATSRSSTAGVSAVMEDLPGVKNLVLLGNFDKVNVSCGNLCKKTSQM